MLASCATHSTLPSRAPDKPSAPACDPAVAAPIPAEPAIQGTIVAPVTADEIANTQTFLNSVQAILDWGRQGWGRTKTAQADCPTKP